MMRGRDRFAALVLTGALVAAGSACSRDDGATPATGSRSPGPVITGPSGATGTTVPLVEADSGSSSDWATYGHDLANTRRNTGERSITASTVKQLRRTWSIDGLVGVTGTPAVVDGVAYFDDWTGAVRAVDVATGTARWTTKLGGTFVGAPAVDGGGVFVAAGATLYRLDRATGRVVWKATTDTNPYAQINASPVVVDGLVLQGTASFENIVRRDRYTFRGSIAAFDAATGAQRWKLYTTPADKTGGAGVGVWSTPAVDRTRGLLFVGTGQSLAPPTSKLADSIIAVDYRTGALRWSRRFTYPDVFSAAYPNGKDADVGASPNLWRAGGRDLVGAGDKGGTFHALDRDTGAIVWERRLTPGSAFGGAIGSAAFVDGVLVATSNVGDPKTRFPTEVTKVFALDPTRGTVRWTAAPFPGKVFAPVSAVPGVAFVATDRGALAALDTRTGRRLWTGTAPARVAAGPAIVDGRVLWGYGFILFGPAGKGGLTSYTLP